MNKEEFRNMRNFNLLDQHRKTYSIKQLLDLRTETVNLQQQLKEDRNMNEKVNEAINDLSPPNKLKFGIDNILKTDDVTKSPSQTPTNTVPKIASPIDEKQQIDDATARRMSNFFARQYRDLYIHRQKIYKESQAARMVPKQNEVNTDRQDHPVLARISSDPPKSLNLQLPVDNRLRGRSLSPRYQNDVVPLKKSPFCDTNRDHEQARCDSGNERSPIPAYRSDSSPMSCTVNSPPIEQERLTKRTISDVIQGIAGMAKEDSFSKKLKLSEDVDDVFHSSDETSTGPNSPWEPRYGAPTHDPMTTYPFGIPPQYLKGSFHTIPYIHPMYARQASLSPPTLPNNLPFQAWQKMAANCQQAAIRQLLYPYNTNPSVASVAMAAMRSSLQAYDSSGSDPTGFQKEDDQGQNSSASSSSQLFKRSGGKKRRKWSRAVFSLMQRRGLEKSFQVQKYVAKPERRGLADALGLTDAQVKIWFQNRRMKWRQELKSGEKAEPTNMMPKTETTLNQAVVISC